MCKLQAAVHARERRDNSNCAAVNKLTEILVGAYRVTCSACKHKKYCNKKIDNTEIKNCLWETKEDYENMNEHNFINTLSETSR